MAATGVQGFAERKKGFGQTAVGNSGKKQGKLREKGVDKPLPNGYNWTVRFERVREISEDRR